jgi:uncharacterized membrane protein
MKSRVDIAILLVLATGVTVYVSLALPGDRSLAVHIYLLVLGAIFMTALLSGLGGAVPGRRRSEFRRALDQPAAKPDQVSELAKVEREVTLAVGSAHDLHTRLLPRLREIAEARLERSGRRPGPDTLGRSWELLRADRPEPANRFAPGIRTAELRALVSDLEEL